VTAKKIPLKTIAESSLKLWVKSFEFCSGVSGGELPIDAFSRVVPDVLPNLDLATVGFDVSDATFQTLIRQNAQTNFEKMYFFEVG